MLATIAAGMAVTLGAGAAQAGVLDDLAAAAAKGPNVVWYESSKSSQTDKIIAAFNARYPAVKVQHIRVVGGNKLAGRVVQEIQARGYSADVITSGAGQTWSLNERGYLLNTDWQALGVDKKLTPTNFAVAVAASVYVILVNTDRVPAAERPRSWDDILDDKWKGRIGGWVRPTAFIQMAKVWGEKRAEAALRKFIALKPFLFKSTFPMAQQVAAGEVDVAIGFFHTAQPPITAGAPLKRISLDPTPMHTIYSAVTKQTRNPAGAKLFLSWLVTPEGAKAYEAATNRGNHLLKGTKTAALLAGAAIAEFPADEIDQYKAISKKFNKILAAGR
jgi:iron(III) transport system substrate-binding protein